ncbi:MAG: HAD-IIIC family phosphatase [Elusimicrobiota bacterium]|jgi:FkbH-like protein|nr:HAD-IIIC family phosphatase [Elusimicrobiota bacterium]
MINLDYPFDFELINKKHRSIKRELLDTKKSFLDKKIAILGGSTTSGIKDMLELFLLNYGIRPEIYESEFGQYWQDAMFDGALQSFKPDIIFIHTTSRNLTQYPAIQNTPQEIDDKIENQFFHWKQMWDKLAETIHCPIIQNNFDRPQYRLLGNKDISDIHGKTNFIMRLNQKFYEYAQAHNDFYINDIDYLAASFGLDKWHDPHFWYLYKYALCVPAIPEFAFNVANIIKAIYGKNKKAFVLDLDNTLWGGVVGDDGINNLEIGNETAVGQAYLEFQDYIKAHKDLGIILTIASKNDYENAIAGLNHPDSSLHSDDFIVIKANWENKDKNIKEISEILNIGQDSLVFVDDNPVERDLVRSQINDIAAAEIGQPDSYIRIIDKSGFFEVLKLSQDDINRNKMYKENVQRTQSEQSFDNYRDFLLSLDMKAGISSFESIYIQRIAQLTNKSNQFNLTTKRYTESDIETIAKSKNHINLYGRLSDKFGDNGLVSVIIGRKENKILHIELWIMSCRVLKRDMEFAMLDALIEECKKQGIENILGYYYPTSKNKMVKEFYAILGFSKINENDNGDTVWEYKVEKHKRKNTVIKIEK